MRRDSNLHQGLTAAGFAIASDPNHSVLIVKYISPGGGHYIDTGASQLIADKKVKIRQGQEVRTIKAYNLVLADGSGLDAGEIVFGIGYQNMREIAWTMLGDELANRVRESWGFDDEGEIRAYGGEVDIGDSGSSEGT